MFLPEYVYWIMLAGDSVLLLVSHLPSIIYRMKKRFKYNDRYVRIICFHLNHTMSSAWVHVDAKDGNANLITYEKKAYLYKIERVLRLPPAFGMYAREPCLFVTENNAEPLDMVDILKQLKTKKGSDELYAAVDSDVFIKLMMGVPKDKTMNIIIILCVLGAIAWFMMEVFGKGGA